MEPLLGYGIVSISLANNDCIYNRKTVLSVQSARIETSPKNITILGSGVHCAVRAKAVERGSAAFTRQSFYGS
jgi:hypothetical protein